MAKIKDPEARIFAVDTRFQRMARREGGVPRSTAIEQARAAIEEVKPGFDQWIDGELQDFVNLIRNAQANEGNLDWIESASFRGRQLRDSATILRFDLLAFIANSLVEILDSIEAGNECNMEAVTCHLDALVLAKQGAYRNLKPDQVPELTKGLRQIAQRITLQPRSKPYV